MGYIVMCRGIILWEPARRVGNLFLSQVTSAEELLHLESGIAVSLADEIEVIEGKFSVFLTTLADEMSASNHKVFIFQLTPLFVLLVVLHERITGIWPVFDESLSEYIVMARELSKYMSR